VLTPAQEDAAMNDRTILRALPLTLDLVDQSATLNGHAIELGPKPFALLRVLMEASLRLVTKEQIFESVWEGRFVSEAVLTTAIRDLRVALGDDAKRPVFIATVHGKGYRFIKPVTCEAPSEPVAEEIAPKVPVVAARPAASTSKDPLRAPSWAALVAAMIIVTVGIVAAMTGLGSREAAAGTGEVASVAVLPFKDLSPQADQGYFADGVSEEVLNVLRRVDGLETASRTSSFAYRKREELTAHQIGQALGVGHVLEGSVRMDGNKVRVRVSLIDAKSDRPAWSRDYERDLSVESMVRLEDEIAERVVSELRRSLGAHLGAQARERNTIGTTNLRAYDSYLRARELFVARKDFDRSIAFAREAVAADPKFARGWELLSAAQFVANGARATPDSLQDANTALQLDPNLSLSHAIKGAMINHSVPIDWNRGFSALERAIELDPENTTALLWLGIDTAKLGYLERAQSLLEKCLEIDPAYDVCRIHLAWTLHARGETDRALYEYRRVVREGSPPDETPLLQVLLKHGDDGEARAMVKQIEASRPMPEEILKALRDPTADRRPAVRALHEWAGDLKYVSDINPIILELGAYDLHEARPHTSYSLWFPEYPELRSSEHFKWFLREMEIDAYWREHGFPPQCRPLGEDDFACD
jgi:adenylate cyclase